MSFDFGEQQASDPAADFLARERAAAGALADDANLFGSGAGAGNSLSALQGQSGGGAGDRDFETSASNFPALDGEHDGFASAGGAVHASQPSRQATRVSEPDDDDDLLGGGGGSYAPPANQERDQFERNFPELDDPSIEPAAAAPQHNGFMAAPISSNMGLPTSGTPAHGGGGDPYGVSSHEEESEAVRKWREEQEEDIARREAEAERKKGETISKAEQDIDGFYADYNKKKERNIAQNKEAEASFKAQRQAELADGTTWSRVTKLLDLQNSQSKTIARTGPGSSDLTRMKEVLLSLRREGETAPGASGY